MATISQDAKHNPSHPLSEGAREYLADMILEVQQVALRLGAGNVSNHLQVAYLELQIERRPMIRDQPDPSRQVRRK